jgi:hypothetical protein
MTQITISGTFEPGSLESFTPFLDAFDHHTDEMGDISLDTSLVILKAKSLIAENQAFRRAAQDAVYLHKLEKLLLLTGTVKKYFILSHLRQSGKPMTLQTLCKRLEQDHDFQKYIPSKNKNTVRSVLRKLVQLHYVDRMDRGVYEITAKGRQMLGGIAL